MSMDEFGLIDLSNLQKKDYSKALLRSNPFPSTAVPSDTPLTTADRKPVLRRFTDVLAALFNDGASSTTTLLGDYGTGKSHLLKLFRISVNDKLLKNDKPIIAIYIKSPGKSIRDMFLYLIDDLGRERLTKLACNYMYKTLKEIGPDKFLIRGRTFTLNDPSQIPKYLDNTMIIDLIDTLTSHLNAVKNSDLVRAFLALPHSDMGAYAWRWFVGSSLSRNERDLMKLESTIDDSQIAERIIDSFVRLMRFADIAGLVLLIDELETIGLITKSAKGVYQDALRHIIDSNPTGLVMIFATTPTEWSKLMETPSALERRLAGSVLDLPPFSEQDVHELVELYLRTARSEKFSTSQKSNVFPFTDDSIRTIFTKTKGTPSKVVLLCRLCIERMLVSDNINEINPTFIDSVIKEEGFR